MTKRERSFGLRKGEKFWVESSHVFRERVSIGHFDRGNVYIFEGCSEDICTFLFFILDTLSFCTPIL